MTPIHFYWSLIAFFSPFKNQILHHRNDSSSSLLHAQIYARFSPLIGGPPILPLHVELLLLMMDHEPSESSENDMDDTPMILHRIDYIPQNPTDSNTIMKLLTLKYVPGTVRHRIYLSNDDLLQPIKDLWWMQHPLDTNDKDDTRKDNHHDTTITNTPISIVNKDRIQSLLKGASTLSLGSTITTSTTTTTATTTNTTMVKLAPSLLELLKEIQQQRELHLLYYNCYSFAYDVYSCLKKHIL